MATDIPYFQHVVVRRPVSETFALLLSSVDQWWPGHDHGEPARPGGRLGFHDGALVKLLPRGTTRIVGAARPAGSPAMIRVALAAGPPEHTVQLSCADGGDGETQVVLVEEGWSTRSGMWPELHGPDREQVWIRALTAFADLTGAAVPPPPPALPFTPQVVGVDPEQARAFLRGRAMIGRRPLPPDPNYRPEPPSPPPPRPEPSPVRWTGAPVPTPQQYAHPADFPWAARISEALCVALVHDRAPEPVLTQLSALGTARQSGRVRSPILPAPEARAVAQAWDGPRYATTLEAGTIGDWTLVVEDNGYLANHRETVGPLSVGTAVAVVYWTVTGRWHFWWAVDGTVVRSFGQDDRWENELTGHRLPQEDGLPEPGDWNRAAGIALLQRLTGVRLTQADVVAPGNRIALVYEPG
jgi:hypothetical protein